MMSQREHGLEPAGEGVGRSGPAEACASRRAGEAAREGGRRRSSASGSTAKRFRSTEVFFATPVVWRVHLKKPILVRCDGFLYSSGEELEDDHRL